MSMNLSELKVFILVGGLGTRLRKIISEVPKPMAPIEGKPFLHHKLIQLKKNGLKNIVFCSGYLSDIIENYFGNGNKMGLNIKYSTEEKALGTGGAIKNAEQFITGNFIVMNGDVYIDANIGKIVSFYIEKKADYVMTLTEVQKNSAGGIVTLDSSMKILEFLEKPDINVIQSMRSPLLNAGLYMLSPEILNIIPKNKKCSIEREIFPKLIGSDKKFYGFTHTGYFIDIGIPDNYYKFIDDIKNGRISSKISE